MSKKADIAATVSPEAIRKGITQLRQTLSDYIRHEGGDPTKYLEIMSNREARHSRIFETRGLRDVRAARMLYYLDYVESRVANIVSATDVEAQRQHALDLTGCLLDFSWLFHQLTIVDQEDSIVRGEKVYKNFAAGRDALNRRRAQTVDWEKVNAEAAKIWTRSPERLKSEVAAALKEKLKLKGKTDTIVRRLKKPRTTV